MLTVLWSNILLSDDEEKNANILDIPELTNGELAHLSGGSGGVYVFTHPQNNKQYTLKLSSSPEALKDEVFADALYQKLGYHAPRCALLTVDGKTLPDKIRQDNPKITESSQVLIRLAEYIESSKTLDDATKRNVIKDQLAKGFVLDCLLSNQDIAGHWENVLVDSNNNVCRIDNGSSLRFRARGELKPLTSRVEEIVSMKEKTDVQRAVYAGIDDKEIQQQAIALLERRADIIALFHEMNKAIGLDQPEFLLTALVNRLQYLHEHISPKLFPYAPAFSEAEKNYTGAGVFITVEINGERKVLLAKRRGHDWWGSFGGASDDSDVFMRDTAARESNEELMGQYYIFPAELDNAASHDLIQVSSDINIAKFRMYFIERNYVSKERLNEEVQQLKYDGKNPEHDEFIWVPLSAIQSASDVAHNDRKYGLHETSRIEFKSNGYQYSLRLHPPFAKMLQQQAVVDHLNYIAAGKGGADHSHTRSRLDEVYPYLIDKNPRLADTVTPAAARYRTAEALTHQGLIHREYVEKRQKAIAEKVNNSMKEKLSSDKSEWMQHASRKDQNISTSGEIQSDIHFKAIMSASELASIESATEEKKVSLFMSKHCSSDFNKLGEAQLQQFASMLKEERRQKNSVVFYHATESANSFLYDVFTEFRKQLQLNTSKDIQFMRALDDFFIYGNVSEFMQAHVNHYGQVDNYRNDYTECGLSVNLALFGSHNSETSATYKLFLENYSIRPPAIAPLFNYFANKLNLEIEYSAFAEIYDAYRKKAGGCIYQFFIDDAYVNEVSYPALPRGPLNPLRSTEGKDLTKLSEILEEIKSNPVKHKEYIATLQARLYLKPDVFHDPKKVTVKTYFANPMSPEEIITYKNKLTEVVRSCVKEIVAGRARLPRATFRKQKPNIQKIAESHFSNSDAGVITYVRSHQQDLIRAIIEGDLEDIIDILIESSNIDLARKSVKRDYASASQHQASPLRLLSDNMFLAVELHYDLLNKAEKYPHLKSIASELEKIYYNIPDVTSFGLHVDKLISNGDHEHAVGWLISFFAFLSEDIRKKFLNNFDDQSAKFFEYFLESDFINERSKLMMHFYDSVRDIKDKRKELFELYFNLRKIVANKASQLILGAKLNDLIALFKSIPNLGSSNINLGSIEHIKGGNLACEKKYLYLLSSDDFGKEAQDQLKFISIFSLISHAKVFIKLVDNKEVKLICNMLVRDDWFELSQTDDCDTSTSLLEKLEVCGDTDLHRQVLITLSATKPTNSIEEKNISRSVQALEEIYKKQIKKLVSMNNIGALSDFIKQTQSILSYFTNFYGSLHQLFSGNYSLASELYERIAETENISDDIKSLKSNLLPLHHSYLSIVDRSQELGLLILDSGSLEVIPKQNEDSDKNLLEQLKNNIELAHNVYCFLLSHADNDKPHVADVLDHVLPIDFKYNVRFSQFDIAVNQFDSVTKNLSLSQTYQFFDDALSEMDLKDGINNLSTDHRNFIHLMIDKLSQKLDSIESIQAFNKEMANDVFFNLAIIFFSFERADAFVKLLLLKVKFYPNDILEEIQSFLCNSEISKNSAVFFIQVISKLRNHRENFLSEAFNSFFSLSIQLKSKDLLIELISFYKHDDELRSTVDIKELINVCSSEVSTDIKEILDDFLKSELLTADISKDDVPGDANSQVNRAQFFHERTNSLTNTEDNQHSEEDAQSHHQPKPG